jgi:hypothetical protein
MQQQDESDGKLDDGNYSSKTLSKDNVLAPCHRSREHDQRSALQNM